jgi:hypothetical protein
MPSGRIEKTEKVRARSASLCDDELGCRGARVLTGGRLIDVLSKKLLLRAARMSRFEHFAD